MRRDRRGPGARVSSALNCMSSRLRQVGKQASRQGLLPQAGVPRLARVLDFPEPCLRGKIVISRNQLAAKETSAICSCYALGSAIEQALVYKGTSSLYRLVCVSPDGTQLYALKVQECDELLLSSKRLEAELLPAVRPTFASVPVLLSPRESKAPMQAEAWGILWEASAISVYEWVDSTAYSGTAQQRRAAAKGFGELQNRLDRFSASSEAKSRAAVLDSVLDATSAEFIPEFSASEQVRYDADQTSGLSPGSLRFLQEQREIVRNELVQNRESLNIAARGLLHSEFTPPNCGYGDDGGVRIIFDFEALRFGLVPLAGALAIATFSLAPFAGATEVARRMAEMLSELRSSCPSASPAPGLLLPLVRLAYVDAAWRQLSRRSANPARRWGFLREDINNLRWLNENAGLIAAL